MKTLALVCSLLIFSFAASAGLDESFLRVENRELAELVDERSEKIEELEMEIKALKERLAENESSTAFNESAAISACSLISNTTYSSYSSECVRSVKEFKVTAQIVKNCSKIRRSFHAVNCITVAGKLNVSSLQVKECAQISSPEYASECVKHAGKGKVEAEGQDYQPEGCSQSEPIRRP